MCLFFLKPYGKLKHKEVKEFDQVLTVNYMVEPSLELRPSGPRAMLFWRESWAFRLNRPSLGTLYIWCVASFQLLLGVIMRSREKPVIVHARRIIWECSVLHNIFFVRTPGRISSQFSITRISELPEQISLLVFPGCCKLPLLSWSLES